jgi:hypothetical protein
MTEKRFPRRWYVYARVHVADYGNASSGWSARTLTFRSQREARNEYDRLVRLGNESLEALVAALWRRKIFVPERPPVRAEIRYGASGERGKVRKETEVAR